MAQSAIRFTLTEVSGYYAARIPNLKRHGKQGRALVLSIAARMTRGHWVVGRTIASPLA